MTEPNRENAMNFVLLIHQGQTPLPGSPEWEALPADEQKAIYADYAALNATAGVTPGLPLGTPQQAKTVRVDKGATVASDGPYVKDGAIGGYLILEAQDIDVAIAVAARIPAARLGGAIEVRPAETSS
jgi:hypothetical protein